MATATAYRTALVSPLEDIDTARAANNPLVQQAQASIAKPPAQTAQPIYSEPAPQATATTTVASQAQQALYNPQAPQSYGVTPAPATVGKTGAPTSPAAVQPIAATPLPTNMPMSAVDGNGRPVQMQAGQWANQMVEAFNRNTGAPGSPDEGQFKAAVAAGLVTNDANGYLAFRGTPAIQAAAVNAMGSTYSIPGVGSTAVVPKPVQDTPEQLAAAYAAEGRTPTGGYGGANVGTQSTTDAAGNFVPRGVTTPQGQPIADLGKYFLEQTGYNPGTGQLIPGSAADKERQALAQQVAQIFGTASPQFGPGNDLRSTYIQPGATPGEIAPTDLSKELGMLDSAYGDIGKANVAGYQQSPEAQRARALALQSLEQSMGGPDRGQLARDRLALLNEDLAKQEATGVQNIGREAARFGRIGAGLTTNQLTDLETTLRMQGQRMAKELALDAADKDVSDRIARTNLATSTSGAFSGEDQAAQAQRRADAGLSLDRAQAGASLAGQRAGLQNMTRSQLEAERAFKTNYEQAARGEQRTERDFQQSMAQQAIENKIKEASLNEQLTQGAFGRDTEAIRLALAAEQSSDPLAALQAAAQQAQAAGNSTLAAQLLELYAKKKAQGSTGSTDTRSPETYKGSGAA